MGTGSLPGVKRPRRGDDHPPPSRVEVKEKILPLWGFIACSRVNITFTITLSHIHSVIWGNSSCLHDSILRVFVPGPNYYIHFRQSN